MHQTDNYLDFLVCLGFLEPVAGVGYIQGSVTHCLNSVVAHHRRVPPARLPVPLRQGGGQAGGD